MPDSTHYPDLLAAHEAAIDAAIREDESRTLAAAIPIWETGAGLDELYIALADVERRRDAADAIREMYDSDNPDYWDAHDAACEAFDKARDDIAMIKRRIEELGIEAGSAEECELRSDYYRSVL